jgi:hypothetical protein
MRSLLSITIPTLDDSLPQQQAPPDKQYYPKFKTVFPYRVDFGPQREEEKLIPTDLVVMKKDDKILSHRVDQIVEILGENYPGFTNDERNIVLSMFVEVPPQVFEKEIKKIIFVGSVEDDAADLVITRLNERNLRIRVRHQQLEWLRTATAIVVSDIYKHQRETGINFASKTIEVKEKGEHSIVFKGELVKSKLLYVIHSNLAETVTLFVGLSTIAILMAVDKQIATQPTALVSIVVMTMVALVSLVAHYFRVRRVQKIVWKAFPED